MLDQLDLPDSVIASMTAQLLPNERTLHATGPVGDDAATDDVHDDVGDGVRSRSNAVLRHTMAKRLITARELNGVSQWEAAKMLGFANSTQLSLWEQAKRPVPLQLVTHIAMILGVSTDWLLGVDDEPERDSRMAARNAVVRQMHALLLKNSEAVAEVLLEAHRFDVHPEIRATRVCSVVVELTDAVERFRALNPELFDNARCGALLLRTATDARSAIDKIASILDEAERRVAFTLGRARAAMAAPMPEAAL